MTNVIAHQPSESFVKEVRAVADAEALAQKHVDEAVAKASGARSEAAAKAVEVAAAAGEKAVAEKNKIVSASRVQTDEHIRRLLDRANARARELAARRLSEAAAQDIAESF